MKGNFIMATEKIYTPTEIDNINLGRKAIIGTTYKDTRGFEFIGIEGNVLKQDLILRITNIIEGMRLVSEQEPLRIPSIKDRLNQFLEDAVGKENIDHNRFEQELIYFIDKLDITEEKTRLKSHCDYFIVALQDKDANGKKLGFISQEIGREINTMGSKANDAKMQQIVVGMKEELEKIKEQLLNVL